MSNKRKIGVILVNLGTPSAPTPRALKAYLAEFLSDPRVIELPRFFWKILLHTIILPIRSPASAHKYKSIWGENASPLLEISQAQVKALQEQFGNEQYEFMLAMRYGQPSLEQALSELKEQSIHKIIILPLYPQYCAATTASVFDKTAFILKRQRYIPELHFIHEYYQDPLYIQALVSTIKTNFSDHGLPEKLILSYHGMPERTYHKGDPYYTQCLETTKLIHTILKEQCPEYSEIELITAFQSRFGKEKWLQPYTSETLETLAKNGVKKVTVMCPGFSADCIETLEEIMIENRDLFLSNGGQEYRYIPALNTDKAHIHLIKSLIENAAKGIHIY